MGWKTINGHSYYYRMTRVGGRVRSTCLGRGPLAELAAAAGVEARVSREVDRGRARAERERVEAEARAFSDWYDRVEALASAALAAAGYHRIKRGPWRRRRMTGTQGAGLPTRAEAEAILGRAAAGEASCLPALRALFDAAPALAREAGDPAAHLLDALLAGYSDDLAVREAVRRRVAEVRAELEGPSPSPLERLLAGRAAVCWLAAHQAEMATVATAGMSLAQADHLERRADAAHRRFLSACKALAQVRKLALPTLQVNVGERQLIVANG